MAYENLLIKPLPQKYNSINHTFFIKQQIGDTEVGLNPKIVDETSKFTKSDLENFMKKIYPNTQIFSEDYNLTSLKSKTNIQEEEDYYEKFKKENTITNAILKEPKEYIIIAYPKKEEEYSEAKNNQQFKDTTQNIDKTKKIKGISESQKFYPEKIDEEFEIDESLILGDTAIKDRIIEYTYPSIKSDSYYLENREIFANFIKQLFQPYKEKLIKEEKDIVSGKKTIDCTNYTDDSFKLFSHQEIIMRYINLYTPYRGLLLYHGLGSGKTCSSIAIAEGLKNDMQVMVLTPASLKQNYIDELKKCGDFLYKKNQFWEFIDTTNNPEFIKPLSSILKLSESYIKKNNGVWMVNATKESNYYTYNTIQQKMIDEQIEMMINYKYSFISYNAPNLKSRIESITSINFDNKDKNPFSNRVVIIDEAHNLISRIINKINISENSSSFSVKLYKKLMDAENCKIILLTGTPIINYPNEIAIAFNILRGYIKTFEFTFKTADSKYNEEYFYKLFEKNNASLHIDYLEYNSKFKILKIIKNPFGFIKNATKNDNKLVYSTNNFNISEFLNLILEIFDKSNIDYSYKIINKLALPHNFNEFKSLFINNQNKLQNDDLFKRRIVGLCSYFRSAQEKLMPKYKEDEDFELIEVEMSNYQFEKYAKVRITERKSEAKKASKLSKKQNPNTNDIYKESVSSYRIFSRAYSNFVFPDSIKRPMPNKDDSVESTLDNMAETDAFDENIFEDINEEEKKEIYSQKYDPEEYAKIDSIKSEKSSFNYKKEITTILKELYESNYLTKSELGKYSPKFLNILENLQNKDLEGIHLLYSQFKTLEGIGIFKKVLLKNGFAELKIKKNSTGEFELNMNSKDLNKPFFACYTGDESLEEKKVIKDILNNNWDKENPPFIIQQLMEIKPGIYDNKMGDFIKLLMITSSGAEGISLKNVRYVHIMEPYWHPVRIKQVIGRARRICSHSELDPEYRNVRVFCYLMKFSSQNIEEIENGVYKDLKNDKSIITKLLYTTDEYLYEISYIKKKITENIENSVKEASIDCGIYPNNDENLTCLAMGNQEEDPDFNTLSYLDDINIQKNKTNDQTKQLNKIEKKIILKPIGKKIIEGFERQLGVDTTTNKVYIMPSKEDKLPNKGLTYYGKLKPIEGTKKFTIETPKKL